MPHLASHASVADDVRSSSALLRRHHCLVLQGDHDATNDGLKGHQSLGLPSRAVQGPFVV